MIKKREGRGESLWGDDQNAWVEDSKKPPKEVLPSMNSVHDPWQLGVNITPTSPLCGDAEVTAPARIQPQCYQPIAPGPQHLTFDPWEAVADGITRFASVEIDESKKADSIGSCASVEIVDSKKDPESDPWDLDPWIHAPKVLTSPFPEQVRLCEDVTMYFLVQIRRSSLEEKLGLCFEFDENDRAVVSEINPGPVHAWGVAASKVGFPEYAVRAGDSAVLLNDRQFDEQVMEEVFDQTLDMWFVFGRKPPN